MIWLDRNIRIHDRKNCTSKEVAQFIAHYLQELDEIKYQKLTRVLTLSQWECLLSLLSKLILMERMMMLDVYPELE